LIVGLGNPGDEHAGTRHNVGFLVAAALVERWGLGRAKERFRGRIVEGTVDGTLPASDPCGSPEGKPGGLLAGAAGGESGMGRDARPARSRVAVLCPQTYMNEAGRSVGPARGAFKLPLERVVVVHDEIDLPFGEVRTRTGGGLAGHNGLKSIKRELGSGDFTRVRVGVGRPDSTDPEIVSAYVLGRFSQDSGRVSELVEHACEAVERLVLCGTPTGGEDPRPCEQRRGEHASAGGGPGQNENPGRTEGAAVGERGVSDRVRRAERGS
jgi:PTH1 family peptidyl-tRNA hydrolase